jgi:hypothetical protein
LLKPCRSERPMKRLDRALAPSEIAVHFLGIRHDHL